MHGSSYSINVYLFTVIQLGQFTEGKISLNQYKWAEAPTRGVL